jgi:protein involved in polysaccharide export with SLBB domain
VVHVFAVSDELRERVWVTGAVNNPGIFEWTSGLQLSRLVARADGFRDTAYRPRLLIYRRNPVDGSRIMLRVSADDVALAETILEDGDSIVVLNREELANPLFVSVDGFVKEPGEYAFAQGMTLRDVILEAGGFVPGANIVEADVSRLTNPLVRTDTTARNFRIQLGGVRTDGADPGAGEWPPAATEMELQPGDRIFIRRAPGYESPAQVTVSGEVLYPGTYVLAQRQERLTDVLRRAGWLTEEAYPEGVRVLRDGTFVAADITEAFRDPTSRSNLMLVAGDSIHVPQFDPTVTVTGAVMFASRVLYRPGMDLSDYLDQAGGTSDIADTRRITVSYANGERATVRRTLFVTRVPEVRPGSVIHVPDKPPEERAGFNVDQFLTRTLTIITTVVTLLLAVDRL